MTIEPWRATSIQTRSSIAVKAADRADAWDIINANIDHVIGLIDAAARSDAPPNLVVLPEFAMQGPPHGMAAADWIKLACGTIPGPITAPLQRLARERQLYIGGHQFESDPEWPGRYFNSCFLIDQAGTVILRYRRINTAAFPSPHDFMDAYCVKYTAAEMFPVVETPLGRLAMIPCGEINVPRWEMYRPFFNNASFYPPNSFLDAPMVDQAAAKPALAQSLRNMAKAGVIVDA